MNTLLNKIGVISGKKIYELLLEGYKKGYNRRFKSIDEYEIHMKKTYEYFLCILDVQSRENVHKKFKNWKEVKFPVEFIMFHEHRSGIKCERHYRILFGGKIFDIPLIENIQFIN